MLHPIQKYREAKGLTMVQLARELECSPAMISLIESGGRRVGQDNARAWEAKTGIPRLSLLFPDEYPYEPPKAPQEASGA